MSGDCLLSIIVPVYNTGEWLGECLATVPERAGLELILSDDGSGEETAELCRQFADKRSDCRLIREANAGLSEARNRGIRAARGEYLLFLDSDDKLDPRGFEALWKALLQTANFEFASESMRVEGAIDFFLTTYYEWFPDHEGGAEFVPEGEQGSIARGFAGAVHDVGCLRDFARSHAESFFLNACRFVLRRDLILERNLYFVPGLLHEDEEWTSRLLSGNLRWCAVPEPLLCYRQARPGSITASVSSRHLRSRLQIICRQDQLVKEAGEDEGLRRFLSGRIAHNLQSILLYSDWLEKADAERLRQEAAHWRAHLRGGTRKEHLMAVLWGLFGLRGAGKVLRGIQRLRGRAG